MGEFIGASPNESENISHGLVRDMAGLLVGSEVLLSPSSPATDDSNYGYIPPLAPDTPNIFRPQAYIELDMPVTGKTEAEKVHPAVIGELMSFARVSQEVFWTVLLGYPVDFTGSEKRKIPVYNENYDMGYGVEGLAVNPAYELPSATTWAEDSAVTLEH